MWDMYSEATVDFTSLVGLTWVLQWRHDYLGEAYIQVSQVYK